MNKEEAEAVYTIVDSYLEEVGRVWCFPGFKYRVFDSNRGLTIECADSEGLFVALEALAEDWKID